VGAQFLSWAHPEWGRGFHALGHVLPCNLFAGPIEDHFRGEGLVLVDCLWKV